MADRAIVAAGLLYGSSATVLVFARSWQQKQATGSSGFRGFTGMRSGRADRVGGACFALAGAAGLLSPLLAGLGRIPLAKSSASMVWAGGAVATAGAVLGSLAQQRMGDSWRIGVDPAERTALVTDGVFAFARNPIFTAMIAVQAGTATMAPTWLSVSGAAALVLACQVQTRWVEEPYLRRTHADAYLAYAARTGRFIPGLGRLDVSVERRPRSAADQV